MTEQLSTQERFKRGAADAGRYFQFMSEFIGFTPLDAATIRETRFIIEKYIPSIVADFYTQLLRYPATRRPFLTRDGRINQAYVELRMQHQAGFWRRTASGVFDEDYARFVDYVGRAHFRLRIWPIVAAGLVPAAPTTFVSIPPAWRRRVCRRDGGHKGRRYTIVLRLRKRRGRVAQHPRRGLTKAPAAAKRATA